MSQKKCVTIYGYSDDLVEIENSQYKEDEIDCYDKAIRFYFVDGTIISICYAQGGVWKITHEAIDQALRCRCLLYGLAGRQILRSQLC